MHLSPKQQRELTRHHSKTSLLRSLNEVKKLLSIQMGNAETMKVLGPLCTIDSKVITLIEKLEKAKIK